MSHCVTSDGRCFCSRNSATILCSVAVVLSYQLFCYILFGLLLYALISFDADARAIVADQSGLSLAWFTLFTVGAHHDAGRIML